MRLSRAEQARLVFGVRELAPAEEIERRYDAINEFEKRVVDSGTIVVKLMLHTSADRQKERLLTRLDKPDKLWKFNPEDIDESVSLFDAGNRAARACSG